MKAIVQINGASPQNQCPIWSALAKEYDIETVWFEPTLDPLAIRPDLVILQCAVKFHDLAALGYGQVGCPIIAQCGDAAVITSDSVWDNLGLLTELHVEGYDYYDKYAAWLAQHPAKPDQKHKLVFLKQCADCHFPPLSRPKRYDWCFVGQVYPAHELRLKHYRNDLIREIYKRHPNGCVFGYGGWERILGLSHDIGPIPQNQVNEIYAQSQVVVSIDAHDGAGYTSTRTIESMHGGHCTFLYDHPGMVALKPIVRNGSHAIYFGDLDTFSDRLRLMRENSVLAESIGAAARGLVLRQGWTFQAWLKRAIQRAKG